MCFTLLLISATVVLKIGFQERHVKSTPNVTFNRLLILILDILDIVCGDGDADKVKNLLL